MADFSSGTDSTSPTTDDEEALRQAQLAAMARAAANAGDTGTGAMPTADSPVLSAGPTSPDTSSQLPDMGAPSPISGPVQTQGQTPIASQDATRTDVTGRTGPTPTSPLPPTTGGSLSQPVVQPVAQPVARPTTSAPAPVARPAVAPSPVPVPKPAPTGAGAGAGAGTGAGAGGSAGGAAGSAGGGASTGQTGGGAGGGLGSIGAVTNQIASITQGLLQPGTPVDAQAMYIQQAKSILSLIDQQEASLRSDFEKQGSTIDPATQAQLDKLKTILSDNITKTQQELNSRGLYDSGIELQLENNLQKGSASDAAQIIGQRFSKLEDQLNQGLAQLRQDRVSTASQFGLAGANAQTKENSDVRSLNSAREQSALQAMLGLRGQYASAEEAAANRKNALDLANLNNTAAMQRALLAASRSGGSGRSGSSGAAGGTLGAPNGFGPSGRNITGYPPVQGEKNPYGGTTRTPNVNADATNAAVAAVGNAANRNAALQSLHNHAADLTASGVDLQAVMDAINAKFPPAVGENGLPLDNTGAPGRGVGGSI